MISTVDCSSSCFALGCSPPGWPCPMTSRISEAPLERSLVSLSTSASSISTPRLEPCEEWKSIWMFLAAMATLYPTGPAPSPQAGPLVVSPLAETSPEMGDVLVVLVRGEGRANGVDEQAVEL